MPEGRLAEPLHIDGRRVRQRAESVSYAASGGTLSTTPPNPYPVAKSLCESYGGTFGVGGPDQNAVYPNPVVWVCNDWSSANESDAQAKAYQLYLRCREDGLVSWNSTFGGTIDTTCYGH